MSTICSYHAHKGNKPMFHVAAKEPHLYLGAELEVENADHNIDWDTRDKDAKVALDTMGDDWVYFETDGSVSSGFEMITQPATLAAHLAHKDSYDNTFRYLVKQGYRGYNNGSCGLHIHVNRSYAHNSDAWLENVLIIKDKFWPQLCTISRRNYQQINSWAKKDNSSPKEIIQGMHNRETDRYSCVNVSNHNTVEFRIFKGTLNPVSYFGSLQLVDAIAKTAKVKSKAEIEAMSWDELVQGEFSHELWERTKNRIIRRDD